MQCVGVLPKLPVVGHQGGAAARHRWPGSRAGISLGRPARRKPGHSRRGTQIKVAHTSHRYVQRAAVFLAPDCPARGRRLKDALRVSLSRSGSDRRPQPADQPQIWTHVEQDVNGAIFPKQSLRVRAQCHVDDRFRVCDALAGACRGELRTVIVFAAHG